MLGKRFITQLMLKALVKTFLDGKRIVLGTFVLSVIIDVCLVFRYGVVLGIGIERKVLRFPLLVRLGLRVLVEHRIFLKLFLYPLLHLQRRKLQKLYGLNLERRQLLCLFLD